VLGAGSWKSCAGSEPGHPPTQLQELFFAGNREQARCRPAWKGRAEDRAPVRPGQANRPLAAHFHHAEARTIGMNPEHAQNPQLSSFRIMVLEPSVQWLVRFSRDDLRPYPALRQLGIECGPIGLRICKGCWTEDVRQLSRAQLHGVAAPRPKEVSVMYQSSQLIDALAQPFIRPKLSQQRNYLAQHEKTVSIAGVAARLLE